MNQLFSKFRELSIRDLKGRREEIFERTRSLINGQQQPAQYEAEDEEEDQPQNEYLEQDMLQQALEEQATTKGHKKNKKKKEDFKGQRYWRQILQTADWMIEVPDNLAEFYTAVRPDAHKCLIILKDYRLSIRDKSGKQLLSCETSTKLYNGTIFEAYYNQSSKFVVVSDLIAWKSNPMTSSQFEFRYSWLISNFNLNYLTTWTQLSAFYIGYELCTLASLQRVYEAESPFPKDGLLFVHKDSFYIHGLNPSLLIWKDRVVSKYFEEEIQKNSLNSRGIGFLNRLGQVKTLENVVLFMVDRLKIDNSHRFLKFTYTGLSLENLAESKIAVIVQSPIVLETVRYYSGPIDSLGKLLFKCNIEKGLSRIEQLVHKLMHHGQLMSE